jgi:hypothetical protein
LIAFPAVSIPTGFKPITAAQAQKSDPQNTVQHFGMLQIHKQNQKRAANRELGMCFQKFARWFRSAPP